MQDSFKLLSSVKSIIEKKNQIKVNVKEMYIKFSTLRKNI